MFRLILAADRAALVASTAFAETPRDLPARTKLYPIPTPSIDCWQHQIR